MIPSLSLLLLSLLSATPDSSAYHYECHRMPANAISYTDSTCWATTNQTTLFVDLKTAEPATLETHCQLLWDDSCLYIRAIMDEPHLWATQTKNEQRIYLDNAFELFVDPDGDGLNYVELEINGLGATWDLLMAKPYRAGGDAISCYDMRGVKKNVWLNGTLNNPNDTDKGWVVTLAVPFENFRGLCSKPYPVAGDCWRINLVRVQWELAINDGGYVKRINPQTGRTIAHYWVWAPHGEVNMHKPECFGVVEFK